LSIIKQVTLQKIVAHDFWHNLRIIYRQILNIKDIEKLQTDLNILGDWAEENEVKINPKN